MKRASYREAISWIAEFDEGAEMDVSVICSIPTVLLVADIFHVEASRVAQDVVKKRLVELRTWFRKQD